MPETSHSVSFSTPILSHEDVLARFWACLRTAGAKGGGQYTLLWLGDEETTRTVANVEGLSRETLPAITEPPSSYNDASFSMWIDTHEFLLTFHRTPREIRYGLLFISNAVRNPGPHWLTRLMGDLAKALDVDCAALLMNTGEEYDTHIRREKGEDFFDIIQDRALGNTDIGFPQLALLRQDKTDPELWEAARNAGHRIGIIRKDWIMISSIHE